MTWTNSYAQNLKWGGEISNYEEKLAIARKIAARVEPGQTIGAGSGSTALVTLQEIGRRVSDEGLECRVIPTSREIEMTAAALNISTTTLVCAKPDWCYDGADEVDDRGNMIKGRGGAMYREKLVMRSAPQAVILVDKSKFVAALGEKFPVPVEADPDAVHLIETALRDMGAKDVELRMAKGKDGPVITESCGFILDATFKKIGPETEKDIKSLTGVIESGLFWGYTPEIVTQ